MEITQGQGSADAQLDLLAWQQQPTDATVRQFEMLVHKLVRQYAYNHQSSDVCLEDEDIVNMGRAMVAAAFKKFDPSRGVKLSTFITHVVENKFRNLKRDHRLWNKRGTVSISSRPGLGLLVDGTSSDDDVLHSYSPVRGLLQDMQGGEDQLVARMDAAKFMESLTPLQAHVFVDHYVNGREKAEIARRFWLTRAQMRNVMRELDEQVRRFRESAGRMSVEETPPR